MMYDSSDRGLASIARAAAMAVALCFGAALAPAIAADEPPMPAPAMTPTPPAASGQPIAEKASKPSKDFTEEDVKKRVDEVVAERSKDGAFVFRDAKLDTDLNLNFEQVKGVRGMEGYGWFANTIFHDKDEPEKQYAIDFWFKPDGDKLTLMDLRVQKGPKREGDGWIMVSRLPVAWWWLPVSEHPGDAEIVRGWQVMSAIHNYIATHKDASGNLGVKDDKTGETVPLEFIEMHQPIRHLKKDGQYFACTDFRKPGSKGRILRHRLLVGREDRQAPSHRRQDAQGSGARGRHLDASAPLHLRGHGLRGNQLIRAKRRPRNRRRRCAECFSVV